MQVYVSMDAEERARAVTTLHPLAADLERRRDFARVELFPWYGVVIFRFWPRGDLGDPYDTAMNMRTLAALIAKPESLSAAMDTLIRRVKGMMLNRSLRGYGVLLGGGGELNPWN